ncbi:hypothetical protein GE09DRAFT_1114699 [Coniochaeta sp. 2T2.1]|nr:hypothetical protein GE09DRAFT_1114699 [Coniochaeta sp. 2T2.1]
MPESFLPPTPCQGNGFPPSLPEDNTYLIVAGSPELQIRIFSDLNEQNFPPGPIDPELTTRLHPNDHGITPGLFVHIGSTPPRVYKAALESKYGFTTEYVDELQMKWLRLKARAAQEQGQPLLKWTDSNNPLDPLIPYHTVWNKFRTHWRDGAVAEMLTKILSDKTMVPRLVDLVLPFWRAVEKNQSVLKGHPDVIKCLKTIICNDGLAEEPLFFDMLDTLFSSAFNVQKHSAPLTPQEQEARGLIETQDANMAKYANAVKYLSRVIVVWLKILINNDSLSPSAGKEHLTAAAGMTAFIQAYPSFSPAETFLQRLAEYKQQVLLYVDLMRVKLSREDYMLQLNTVHAMLQALPAQMTELEIRTYMLETGENKFIEALCEIWISLGIRPEPWMMHYSHSEEEIRQEARRRAEAMSKGMMGAGQGGGAGNQAPDNSTSHGGKGQ